MDLKEILELQISMDELHGFPVQFTHPKHKYDQLTKDLVGLFGEIGEFSNVVKKVNIKLDNPVGYDFDIDLAEENLKEELVDSFIYIIRLATILKIDLDLETVKKIRLNAVRYAGMQHE